MLEKCGIPGLRGLTKLVPKFSSMPHPLEADNRGP